MAPTRMRHRFAREGVAFWENERRRLGLGLGDGCEGREVYIWTLLVFRSSSASVPR